MIGVTLWSAHHALGFIVADDRPVLMVPREFTAEHEREVSKDTQIGHSSAPFDVHDTFLAGANSLEPIFHVAGAFVDVVRAGRHFPIEDLVFGPRAAVPAPMHGRTVLGGGNLGSGLDI